MLLRKWNIQDKWTFREIHRATFTGTLIAPEIFLDFTAFYIQEISYQNSNSNVLKHSVYGAYS